MQTKVGARMSVRGMSRLGFLVSSAIWLTLPAPESVLVRRPTVAERSSVSVSPPPSVSPRLSFEKSMLGTPTKT